MSVNGVNYTGQATEIYNPDGTIVTYFSPDVTSGPFETGIEYAIGEENPSSNTTTVTSTVEIIEDGVDYGNPSIVIGTGKVSYTGGEGGTFIASIIATSVLNNPYTACVYNNLKNNTVYQGLVKGFTNTNKYNLILQVGSIANNLQATGTTSYGPGNNVITTFNINEVSTISIAQLAETFLHEGYHAYIDQLLLLYNNTGTTIFNQTYATSFDQLVAYRVDSAENVYKAPNNGALPASVIQSITHNMIAQDIVKMGAGLQQFKETIYPNVKNMAEYTPAVYQNFIWASLSDSQAFTTIWGAPSTWGGLPNPPAINTAGLLLNQIPSPCYP